MSKEPRIKMSKESIQLVYIKFDGMWLVFTNENANWYEAGIKKSLQLFHIKIYSVQSAIQRIWYMSGI